MFSVFNSSNLTGVDLAGALLTDALLTGADLSAAILWAADLESADFSAVDLQTVIGLDTTSGGALYTAATLFPSGFDPIASGWTLLGSSAAVPEPAAAFGAALGLLLLSLVRRRSRTAAA
jgi:uncharacterized protein YjbI with pentapeptide repeats